MDTIQVRNFVRPNGKSHMVTVPKVYPEDAKYINENKIQVSMEDIGTDFCVWFDDGTKLLYSDEPDEIIVLAQGRTCEETLKEGVRLIKLRKESKA